MAGYNGHERAVLAPGCGNRPSHYQFALSLSRGPSVGRWFDRPVLSAAEGLTTNGIGDGDYYKAVLASTPSWVFVHPDTLGQDTCEAGPWR